MRQSSQLLSTRSEYDHGFASNQSVFLALLRVLEVLVEWEWHAKGDNILVWVDS